MSNKIVTFGELMLRLVPEGYLRFLQADKFGVTFGGAEANVAVSLANFGSEVSYVTKLPEHEIGQAALNSLRRYGVSTDDIIRGGDRIGIYYLEKGASQRPSKVIYDRAGSAIAMIETGEFDWEKIFEDASWFHFTGITPALGDNVAEECINACKVAKKKGITISCDLNYRKKLWNTDKAGEVMSKLAEYIDICIANEEDLKDVWGIEDENSNIQDGTLNVEGYEEIAKNACDRFGFRKLAITLRKSISASLNDWSAILYDKSTDTIFNSAEYSIQIVDRVGGGDSFGAGLIYMLNKGEDNQAALDFATAASCLQQTIEGDYSMVSVAEVKNLADGNASGRVIR